MAKQNPNAPVTNKKLDEAVDAVLKGIDKILENIDWRFESVEGGQREIKKSIDDLKWDTPAQQEVAEEIEREMGQNGHRKSE